MTSLATSLAVRKEEFDSHFELAKALEDRIILDEGGVVGAVSLSARHINTLKSGLLVHLYNIVEAVMSQSMSLLGAALGEVNPRRWTEHSLREWLREAVVSRTNEGNEDGRLATVFQTSSTLLTQSQLGPQKLKKPSGTWDDKVIAVFLKRMSIKTSMPSDMWSQIAASPRYGDLTPLQFLADRRNAIAHGRRSFEDGGKDMRLDDIKDLSHVTLRYMQFTAIAITQHIEAEAFLAPAA
ncbi:MAG: MAE_28990/MAE_18760 family HEPN-like nuclease [Pacificimonas sp.]